MALNTVVHGIVGDAGRVVVSDLEHNAVVRPIAALAGERSRYDVAAWSPNPEQTVEHFHRAIRPDTKLMVCTHASNVFGCVFPLRQLSRLAHDHGLLFCVDAAQSAGVLSLDMERDGIDYLCVAPHKGLYAPMGTGMLLCREAEQILPLVRGGTGRFSLQADQPSDLPDRLESGTPNVAGLCGIRAGLDFVREKGADRIYRHELACLQYVYERLSGHPAIRFYTPYPQMGKSAPVLSLNVADIPSEEVAAMLDTCGIAVRAGLHCAPWAHRRFGTLQQGTVRLAPSVFSTIAEAEEITKVFLQIAEKSLRG
jgi:selenocysteine lyase/cysteine desulfurase